MAAVEPIAADASHAAAPVPAGLEPLPQFAVAGQRRARVVPVLLSDRTAEGLPAIALLNVPVVPIAITGTACHQVWDVAGRLATALLGDGSRLAAPADLRAASQPHAFCILLPAPRPRWLVFSVFPGALPRGCLAGAHVVVAAENAPSAVPAWLSEVLAPAAASGSLVAAFGSAFKPAAHVVHFAGVADRAQADALAAQAGDTVLRRNQESVKTLFSHASFAVWPHAGSAPELANELAAALCSPICDPAFAPFEPAPYVRRLARLADAEGDRFPSAYDLQRAAAVDAAHGAARAAGQVYAAELKERLGSWDLPAALAGAAAGGRIPTPAELFAAHTLAVAAAHRGLRGELSAPPFVLLDAENTAACFRRLDRAANRAFSAVRRRCAAAATAADESLAQRLWQSIVVDAVLRTRDATVEFVAERIAIWEKTFRLEAAGDDAAETLVAFVRQQAEWVSQAVHGIEIAGTRKADYESMAEAMASARVDQMAACAARIREVGAELTGELSAAFDAGARGIAGAARDAREGMGRDLAVALAESDRRYGEVAAAAAGEIDGLYAHAREQLVAGGAELEAIAGRIRAADAALAAADKGLQEARRPWWRKLVQIAVGVAVSLAGVALCVCTAGLAAVVGGAVVSAGIGMTVRTALSDGGMEWGEFLKVGAIGVAAGLVGAGIGAAVGAGVSALAGSVQGVAKIAVDVGSAAASASLSAGASTMAINAVEGRPLMDGVGKAMVGGLVVGAAGGAVSQISSAVVPSPTPPPSAPIDVGGVALDTAYKTVQSTLGGAAGAALLGDDIGQAAINGALYGGLGAIYAAGTNMGRQWKMAASGDGDGGGTGSPPGSARGSSSETGGDGAGDEGREPASRSEAPSADDAQPRRMTEDPAPAKSTRTEAQPRGYGKPQAQATHAGPEAPVGSDGSDKLPTPGAAVAAGAPTSGECGPLPDASDRSGKPSLVQGVYVGAHASAGISVGTGEAALLDVNLASVNVGAAWDPDARWSGFAEACAANSCAGVDSAKGASAQVRTVPVFSVGVPKAVEKWTGLSADLTVSTTVAEISDAGTRTLPGTAYVSARILIPAKTQPFLSAGAGGQVTVALHGKSTLVQAAKYIWKWLGN